MCLSDPGLSRLAGTLDTNRMAIPSSAGAGLKTDPLGAREFHSRGKAASVTENDTPWRFFVHAVIETGYSSIKRLSPFFRTTGFDASSQEARAWICERPMRSLCSQQRFTTLQSDESSTSFLEEHKMIEQVNVIQAKVGVLELAKQLGNVSKACKIMGYSRDSYYRFKKLYESGGEAALKEVSRRRPILKNRVAPEIERAVLGLAVERPRWGQAKVAGELAKRGLSVSAAGVRCIWLRHGLQTTELRLRTLEYRSVSNGESSGLGFAMHVQRSAEAVHMQAESLPS